MFCGHLLSLECHCLILLSTDCSGVWLFKFRASNLIMPSKLWILLGLLSLLAIGMLAGCGLIITCMEFYCSKSFCNALCLILDLLLHGQYVSGDFVLLHQVVAKSSWLFVIKQRLKMLNDTLIVQRKLPVEWMPICWKPCCLRPLMRYFGEWCHAVYTTFCCGSSFPFVFRLWREVRPNQSG